MPCTDRVIGILLYHTRLTTKIYLWYHVISPYVIIKMVVARAKAHGLVVRRNSLLFYVRETSVLV